MKKYAPSLGLTKFEFRMIQFSIHIHNLGLDKFNIANAEKIGNKIGKFIEAENEHENVTTCYLRFKVDVDSS